MHKIQLRRNEMLLRISTFAQQHPELFPARSIEKALLTKILTLREQLTNLSTTQLSESNSSRRVTESKTESAEAMRDLMQMIAQTARLIARKTPRFDEPFHLPRSRSEAALLHSARLFAEYAAPHAATFIQYGLPENFIGELHSNIQNVENAGRNRSSARVQLKTATAAITSAMREAVDAAAELNVIMTNKLRLDQTLLKVWRFTSHVTYPTRRKAAASGGSE